MLNAKRFSARPSFTVVIPLYNKERHIRRALESVTGQTFLATKIIVVDDGSTDAGTKAVERFNDPFARIKLIKQKNSGVSNARNVGIAHAEGSHVAFLDADDAWDPGYLSEIAALVEKFPHAGAYCTSYRIVQSNGTVRLPPIRGVPYGKHTKIENYFKAAFHGSPVWTSATVVPLRILNEVGRFLPGAGRGEDLDLWCRIAVTRYIAFSRARCATYHQDADNRSTTILNSNTPIESLQGRWWGIDRLADLEKNPTIKPSNRRWIREWILWLDILASYSLPAGNDRSLLLNRALAKAHGHYAFFYALIWMAWKNISRYSLKIHQSKLSK